MDVAHTDAEGVEQTESLPDVESLTGSAHNDILAGDRRDNAIDGRAGDDTLYGGPGGGDDMMNGGPAMTDSTAGRARTPSRAVPAMTGWPAARTRTSSCSAPGTARTPWRISVRGPIKST